MFQFSSKFSALAGALFVAFALGGCADVGSGDSEGEAGSIGDGEGSNVGSSGSGEQVCYDIHVNTTEGGEACGTRTCAPGEFCDEGCWVGCFEDATCPRGQFCEHSDLTGDGTCRTPGPEHVIACASTPSTGSGAPSCIDVCEAKTSLCGGTSSICGDLCVAASQEQLTCLQAAPCSAFADGEECGFSFGGSDG